MFGSVKNACAAIRRAVVDLDRHHPSGPEAASLVELFSEIEHVAAAGRTLAARWVEESKVWQKTGHRTAAQWVAAATGASLKDAIGVLDAARRLEHLPATREAFCAGRLSEAQSQEIIGVDPDPTAELALIETAQTETLKTLREACSRVRAAQETDESAAHTRIHGGRFLRYWSDRDGAVRLEARLTPEAGAVVIAAVEARQDRLYAQARAAGVRETAQACAADALVEMAAGSAGESGEDGPRAMVHVLVDHAVLSGIQAGSGRRCEIPGVGPISAASARALAADSIIKAIVTKGADIHSVVHVGRSVPSRIRTALQVRDPVCVVPRCDIRAGLEIDHYDTRYAAGGPTRLANLARICRWHHYQKTHCGYRLSGGPGQWTWLTPDDLEGSTADPDP